MSESARTESIQTVVAGAAPGTDPVPPPGPNARRGGRLAYLVGAAASLGLAIALFTRYNLDGTLSRDEGIYLYGGQQLARHGVAPYASIFDPKGPLADMLCALGVALGELFGIHDVTAVRLLFLAFSLATVVAVYGLAHRLFSSVVAGVAAAVVMASYAGFANDAMQGPDAKTPALLCLVLAMWLATKRRWLWVGVLSSLCVLDWQPFFTYVLALGLCALLLPTEDRTRLHWRSLGIFAVGAAVPVAATATYFLVDGTWRDMWESAVLFPLTGIQRAPQTLSQHLEHMRAVVASHYLHSGPLLYAGLILLLALAVVAVARRGRGWAGGFADPVVSVVLFTGALQLIYMLYDFQGYPDVYPALPYGALGVGGAVGFMVNAARNQKARAVLGAVGAAAVVVLVAFDWTWFAADPANDRALRGELSDACAIQRSLGRNGTLWSLGFPPALVLTQRRNPDPFIYLDSGVGRWKIDHTAGGLRGWESQIRSEHPGVVVLYAWAAQQRRRLREFLHDDGYHLQFFGPWTVMLDDAALARATAHGVDLTHHPTRVAIGTDLRPLPGYACLS